jgi:hypothetical protein
MEEIESLAGNCLVLSYSLSKFVPTSKELTFFSWVVGGELSTILLGDRLISTRV